MVFADFNGNLHIFKGCQIGHQIIELKHKAHIAATVQCQVTFAVCGNVVAVKHDFSVGYGVHAAEQIQKRGFPGARRAENDNKFSFVQIE